MSRRNELKAVVAERGQITIPKLLRDKLGIVPGTEISFKLQNGKIILTKEFAHDPVAAVYGCLKKTVPYKSTDDYINEIRGAAE